MQVTVDVSVAQAFDVLTDAIRGGEHFTVEHAWRLEAMARRIRKRVRAYQHPICGAKADPKSTFICTLEPGHGGECHRDQDISGGAVNWPNR